MFLTIFYLLLGCFTDDFGLLSKGQTPSPNLNHCFVIDFRPISVLIKKRPKCIFAIFAKFFRTPFSSFSAWLLLAIA